MSTTDVFSRSLPPNGVLRKRKLTHPPISSQRTLGPKHIYIARKSPFVSTVKRVRKYFTQAESQRQPPSRSSNNRQRPSQPQNKKDKPPIEVVLKATGRGIQNALGLALYFQGQKDCEVKIETGTIEVVDDVVFDQTTLGLEEILTKRLGGGEDAGGEMDVDEEVDDELDEMVDDELGERRRNIPVIEVKIRKKG